MDYSPLAITNLSKKLGDIWALDDISLSLQPGEIFGFLGPNGAGKSTTIRCVMDFIRPSSGKIKVLGVDSVSSSKILQRVGYMPGDVSLYGEMTGRGLVDYISRLTNRVDANYVASLVDRLDAEMNKKIDQLSKGNRQKIAVIISLMSRPELLILDEPTSGLDPLIKQEFYDIILEAKLSGKTTFISSHDLSEVQKICDRAAFIRKGKIIAVESMSNNVSDRSIMKFRFRMSVTDRSAKAGINLITGVSEVVQEPDGWFSVTFVGELPDLFAGLSKLPIIDIEKHDLDLEEIFMHYYQSENKGVIV